MALPPPSFHTLDMQFILPIYFTCLSSCYTASSSRSLSESSWWVSVFADTLSVLSRGMIEGMSITCMIIATMWKSSARALSKCSACPGYKLRALGFLQWPPAFQKHHLFPGPCTPLPLSSSLRKLESEVRAGWCRACTTPTELYLCGSTWRGLNTVVHILTPGTCDCDLIWKQRLCGGNLFS